MAESDHDLSTRTRHEGCEDEQEEEETSPFLNLDVEPVEKGTKPGRPAIRFSNPVKTRYLWITMVSIIALAVAFVTGLLVGDLAIAKPNKDSTTLHKEEVCSDPPLLLVSLDGFKPSYLSMYPGNTTILNSLATKGVRPEYMRSVFPSKTFPNHFSIVTGLYPESHGIVGNHFYDKELGEKFNLGGSSQNDPKWWLGEPIPVTAAKSGLNTGVFFWPGSEVEIQGTYPTYYYPYSWRVPFKHRVNTVLSWLDLPKETRPKFIGLYFNEPDHSAHSATPNSPEVAAALEKLQTSVDSLMSGLEDREISNCVNIIFTSDHGMTTYNSSNLVILDDLFPSQYSKYVNYPSLGVIAEINIINGGGESVLEAVYDALVKNSTGKPISVFRGDHLPLRLHAGQHNKQRYGDIYIIGDVGAYITTRKSANSGVLAGQHGYDNNNPEMQAFFLAHGPAFKKGYEPEPFDNIQLYNLMCALLGITPAPNNGTIGSLNHLLVHDLAAKPLAMAPSGQSGKMEYCSYPSDGETYTTRVSCTSCLCQQSNEVTPAAINAANQALNLTHDQVLEYQKLHLPWGVPSGGEGEAACILTHPGYVSLYSHTLHIPLWTAHRLTAQVQSASTAAYHQDPRVNLTSSANCSDYLSASNFYHMTEMVPSEDVSESTVDQLSTALMTNIVPQLNEFYQGVWGPLEAIVRQWAEAYSTVYVISGVIMDDNHDGVRDNDYSYNQWLNGDAGGVAIPTHFYKMIVRCASNSDCLHDNPEILAMVLPQANSIPLDLHGYVQLRLATVRDIEEFSGVNFFPNLSPEAQNRAELRIQRELWPYSL